MIRHSTDRQFSLGAGCVRLDGPADSKIRLVCEGTLKRIDMRVLADYFRNTADQFATGEFWGKLMRAACMLCAYTGDGDRTDVSPPFRMHSSHRERTAPTCGSASMH